jgi:hypothetical protein
MMQAEQNSLQLSGFVSEFPLLEVIQFLGMTEKSGALCISREKKEDTVTLYFKEGKLLHAVSSESEGMGTFYSALALENGYFKFIAGEPVPTVTIDKPVHFLLLESQRRKDELNHLQKLLPPDGAVLFIVPELKEVPRLNTFEWKIISMVNSRRSIRRICEKIGDELEVKKNLLTLFSKGVISTGSTDSDWKYLIPILISSRDLKVDRPYPPLLRTNLLLKSIDGKTTLRGLEEKLKIKENELVEDVKLLYETRWIKFSTAHEKVFSRLKGEL